MKSGKPLPDYFDKYKNIFDTILAINVGSCTVGQLKPRDLTVEHCESYILPTLFNSGKKVSEALKLSKRCDLVLISSYLFAKAETALRKNPMLDAEFKKTYR